MKKARQLKKLLDILNQSVKNNGEGFVLTVGHLRNIVNLTYEKFVAPEGYRVVPLGQSSNLPKGTAAPKHMNLFSTRSEILGRGDGDLITSEDVENFKDILKLSGEPSNDYLLARLEKSRSLGRSVYFYPGK